MLAIYIISYVLDSKFILRSIDRNGISIYAWLFVQTSIVREGEVSLVVLSYPEQRPSVNWRDRGKSPGEEGALSTAILTSPTKGEIM